MLRRFLPLALVLLCWLPARAAWASGDFTCYPAWKLNHAVMDDCSNSAFLSPGNDSRINLQLLMLDRRGPAPARSKADAADQALFTLDDFNAAVTAEPDKAPADTASTDSDLADGEGSRCRSNALGTSAFVAALNAARGLPDAERAALAKARTDLAPSCNGGAQAQVAAAKLSVRSAPGRQFAGYLTGAAAFYDGDYDAAHTAFAALSSSNLPWLKEAARYMLGRVELNRAQVDAFDDFEDHPSPAKVDAGALAEAEAAFQAYLRDYPRGDYAASARGLLRRVYWLGGQPGKLSDEYAQVIAHPDAAPINVTTSDLALEIDNKLLAKSDASAIADIGAIKAPVLLAALDLVRMRGADQPASDQAKPKAAFSLADLEAQRPLFANDQPLFDYLLAAHHFYVEKDPTAALTAPAEGADPAGSYLAFSRQVLRGLALEQTHDKTARALWMQLYGAARQPFQRGAAELALAMNHERGGDLGPAFAPDSVIRNADIREILLRHDAGPDLLRERARAADAPDHERRVALYVLLYKEMTHGRYPAFLQDMALTPPAAPKKPDGAETAPNDPDMTIFAWSGDGPNGEQGYPCPGLHDLAKALGKSARDPHGLMCLGEFIRENELDGSEINARRPADELGGAPSQFPGADPSRLDIYEQVIADAKAPAADRAYALYRAINCYGPSGYNHCDGAGVEISQRKQWFTTLKTTYAHSTWAGALKYYW
jgi:hypothetical protein